VEHVARGHLVDHGIDHHAEILDAHLLRQHLHGGVGIHQRCRLGRDHQDDFLGHPDEEEHVVANAGARIDEHQIEALGQAVEGGDEAQLFVLAKLGQLLNAGGRGQDVNARPHLDEHVVGRHLGIEQIAHVPFGLHAEDDLDVGQAEIGVDDQHALAALGAQHGQVGGQHGLAHPALAAGHGHHAQRF
jgi:hypothetical protein